MIFLIKIEALSKVQPDIRMYACNNREKLYARMLGRLYLLNERTEEVVSKEWLKELYDVTNGIDLKNFYVVPYHNYFNKKSLPLTNFVVNGL